MIRKLILLPLILVFISCTVTKRVHRRGFHVQWHKIERTQKSDKLESKIKENKRSSEHEAIALELAALTEVENDQPQPTIVTDPPQFHQEKILDESSTSDKDKNIEESNSHSFQTNSERLKRPTLQKAVPPIFWRTPPENLRKLGIALMILGGIILLGSLLVYLGAFSGTGDAAWLNFFLDLIDLSDWFWLFFVLIAVILALYLSFLFVTHVLGGPGAGLIVGLGLLGLGLFFYLLGQKRIPEPPN